MRPGLEVDVKTGAKTDPGRFFPPPPGPLKVYTNALPGFSVPWASLADTGTYMSHEVLSDLTWEGTEQ